MVMASVSRAFEIDDKSHTGNEVVRLRKRLTDAKEWHHGHRCVKPTSYRECVLSLNTMLLLDLLQILLSCRKVFLDFNFHLFRLMV